MSTKSDLLEEIKDLERQRVQWHHTHKRIKAGEDGDQRKAWDMYTMYRDQLKEAKQRLATIKALEPARLKKPDQFTWVDEYHLLAINCRSVGLCRYWCPFCGRETIGLPVQHYADCRRGEIK